MRASRLVQLLLLLQARGRMTAAALAQELEVSERTIHRDVDALSAAGVPIFGERGPHGGMQLVDGYRTRLTGLTGDEAEALFLSGMPGPAAELGLGTVMAAARVKVMAAMPAELRERASRLVERFHLDTAGWFHADEEVPHLAPLAEAVLEARSVVITYLRGDGRVDRTIEPLGLVLKGGIWYVVARIDDGIRTYRAARITGVSTMDERFDRPPSFDLAAHWSQSSAAYEREAPHVEVVVRIDPNRIGFLADLVGERAVQSAQRLEDDDPDGWHRLSIRIDWPNEAPGRLVALGEAIDVLGPPAIRRRVVELAERIIERHRDR